MKKIKWKFGILPKYTDNNGVMLITKHPIISKGIQKQIFFSEYEAKEIDIIKNRISPDDVVMEVGAGIGYISAYCAKIVGDDKVFAYEANPALIELITLTHKANNISPTVINSMLEKGEGSHEFYIEDDYWASSTIKISKEAKKITVPQKDINLEIEKIQPTFLIVDIEGGEIEFFQAINLETINKICIETHPGIVSNKEISMLFNKLFSEGFSLDFSLIRKNVFFLYK